MADIPVAGLTAIALCLVGSAFFSGSETALTSLGQAKARELMDEGGKAASVLQLWLDKPMEVLTTILIGNNIVNITASAVATQVSETLLGGGDAGSGFGISPVAVAIGVMTLMLLTFGEITPKTIAKANFQRYSVVALIMLKPLVWLLRPVSAVFIYMSHRVARLTGRSLSSTGSFVTVDYLEKLIEIGEREGSIEHEDAGLFQSVIDFTETGAREIMIPRTDLVAVPEDITPNELLSVFIDAGHSRLPVFRGTVDEIIGLFYAKDMLVYLRDRADDAADDASELLHMLRPVTFVHDSKPIDDLLREMQEDRVHMSILVDEHGGVAGIVTLEDIIEEIFGEIRDEYDTESERIQQLSNDVWLVSAAVNLEDLRDEIGIHLEVDGNDTLGGYLVSNAGSVPKRGDVVDMDGFRLTVEDGSERRLMWVRVERVTEPETTDAPDV